MYSLKVLFLVLLFAAQRIFVIQNMDVKVVEGLVLYTGTAQVINLQV